MSKEQCNEAKKLMKQTLGVLQQCGTGKGTSMAITHVEDAYLRLDFHMREMGWIDQAPQNVKVPTPIAPQRPAPRPDVQTGNPARLDPTPPVAHRTGTLAPAQAVPRLRTGLMDSSPAPSAPKAPAQDLDDDMSDVSLLP